MNDSALFIAVFLACVVESVEATTIVLAAGTARNWRSALAGVFAGILVLTLAVAVFGPAISLLPLWILRLVVGGLLLVFGLQWLRKAILRASGNKPPHDEDKIYRSELAEARAASSRSKFGVHDWYGFTLSFKGVVLEGLEIVFIVLTFGTNQHNLPLASAAAGAAVVVVGALGVAVRAPLSRVPENTLKFIVGVMLTSFGMFWGAEGAGAEWPGVDTAILILVVSIAVFALLIVRVMRQGRVTAEVRVSAAAVPTTQAPDKPTSWHRLKAFGLFWYDFIIGDDWQVAVFVAVALALTAWLSATIVTSWWLMPVAIALLLPYSIRRALNRG